MTTLTKSCLMNFAASTIQLSRSGQKRFIPRRGNRPFPKKIISQWILKYLYPLTKTVTVSFFWLFTIFSTVLKEEIIIIFDLFEVLEWVLFKLFNANKNKTYTVFCVLKCWAFSICLGTIIKKAKAISANLLVL